MSGFGLKRKARKIQVEEDVEDTHDTDSSSSSVNSGKCSVAAAAYQADCGKIADTVHVANLSGPKPFRKSGLRQSIHLDEIFQETNDTRTSDNGTGDTDGDNHGASRDVKPSISRSSSMAKKKKPAASRLSFGPGEIISGDAAEALEYDETFAPKKATLGRRVIESNAFRKNLPFQGLPPRKNGDDEDRPIYSKDYLNELKSLTPSAPKNFDSLNDVEEDVGLDASELEGAMIVDSDEKFGSVVNPTLIPTESEIKEKKERRARLAKEKDFISLNDDDNDQRQVSLLPRKKKLESRLVRDDEDLGEGFDEFVDDGRISLGKKQEREAKRRQRKEMAEMINQAEGSSNEDTDDSEAERRAAYEAAQTRAGMDGLHKPGEDLADTAVQIPSRVAALPVLSECLERLQSTMNAMELQLAQKHKIIADLEQERKEILAREVEVQELLKQAGARYSALAADSNGAPADPQAISSAHNGALKKLVSDRGLESFGNTPTTRLNVEDIG